MNKPFIFPNYKTKENMKQFEPYDKVLIRFSDNTWRARLFSHKDKYDNYTVTSGGAVKEKDIIPFEGNEHLLGTNENPEEGIILDKEERIICSDNIEVLINGGGYITKFSDIDEDNNLIIDVYINQWFFCIPFSEFEEKNSEHDILCVRNGKLVRYE